MMERCFKRIYLMKKKIFIKEAVISREDLIRYSLLLAYLYQLKTKNVINENQYQTIKRAINTKYKINNN